MEQQLDFALDLMRRLPPTQVANNLAGLLNVVPELTEDLLQSIDKPFKINYDQETDRDYLLCDYNRDGDSYRSPWSNKYDPPVEDGTVPPPELRELELQMNDAFDIYRELYYEGGVSSVYLWESDPDSGSDNFAGALLIKKTAESAKGGGQPMEGSWDVIHVFEAENAKGKANYKLTTTVMLSITTESERSGKVVIAGNLTRQVTKENAVIDGKDNTHITNLGSLIEATENSMRMGMEQIYLGRTKDIVFDLRKKAGVAAFNASRDAQKTMSGVPF